MKTGILYTILLCVTTAGFVGWRVYAIRTQGIPHFELVEDPSIDRKSTRLNSSHIQKSRMPSSA